MFGFKLTRLRFLFRTSLISHIDFSPNNLLSGPVIGRVNLAVHVAMTTLWVTSSLDVTALLIHSALTDVSEALFHTVLRG